MILRGMLVTAALVVALSGRPGLAQEPIAASELPPPQLESVQFLDRVYFREETLKSFLLHPVPAPLDEELLRRDAETLEARYKDRGFLKARVQHRLTPATSLRSYVAVFEIDAGERAELREVHVVGNVEVDDEALTEGFFSRPPELFSAITRAGFFHRPYLDQDAQRLVANYYKRGYLEARVLRTDVDATPDLEGVVVTMYVFEGAVYELAGVAFTGDLPEGQSSEDLAGLLAMKRGDVADLITLQQQVDQLLNPLRDEGYAFARVEQGVQVVEPPSGDPERRGIALTYNIVKGPPATVRKVRIVGNQGTMEHVIRRDVTVEEGARYHHAALLETQRKVMSSGFFSQVVARPVPVAGSETLVDVEVTVTEQPTWIASVAPTWGGQSEGLVGILILADRNLLGTGIYGSIQGVFSGLRQLFDVQLVEPRLLGSNVRVSLEGHRREIGYRHFKIRSEGGGGVGVVVPVGFGFSLSSNVLVEYGGVIPYDDLPVLETPLLPQNELRNIVSAGVLWDQRDSVLAPRNGAFASLSLSYGGPFTLSGIEALETTTNLRLFWTPFWDITLKSNTTVGFVMNPHGGPVPVTDRLFLGGFGSLRGFPIRTIGPEVVVPLEGGETARITAGGVFSFLQNLELEFPLFPGTPFRGFVFIDAGNAYGEDEPWFSAEVQRGPVKLPYNLGRSALPLGLHLSTGFGLVLETPVLPFRFEWGVPLNKRPGDNDLDFFLGVGSAF